MLVAGLLAALLLAALGVRDELGPLAWIALLLVSLGLALPVHELIHAAAFRLLGGPSVRVRFGYAKGMLWASAAGVILSRRRFVVVLLAPVTVLSLTFLACGVTLGCPLLGWLCFAVHLSGCSGDLAMVCAICSRGDCTHVRDSDCGIDLLG